MHSINSDDDSNTDNSQNSSYNSDDRSSNNNNRSNSDYLQVMSNSRTQVISNSSTSLSNLREDEDDDDEDMPRISLGPPTPMPFILPSPTLEHQPFPLPHTILGTVRKSSPVSPSQSYQPQSLPPHSLTDAIRSSNSKSNSGYYAPPKSDEFRKSEPGRKRATDFKSGTDPRETLRGLRLQIQELLETGMYCDRDDPVIAALNDEITLVEAMVVSLHI